MLIIAAAIVINLIPFFFKATIHNTKERIKKGIK